MLRTCTWNLTQVVPENRIGVAHLVSSGHSVRESMRKDIKAMVDVEWNDWKQFGGARTKKRGEKVALLNWSLFVPLLPRSLTSLEIRDIEPMENPFSLGSSSECPWPPKLTSLEAFAPLHLWSSLPQGLQKLQALVENSYLVELASNLKELPKLLLNDISISFVGGGVSKNVDAFKDLPTFTKLLQERPHLHITIGGCSMRLPISTRGIQPFPAAVEATFGLEPSH